MNDRKLHPILQNPHEYDLTEFQYVVDRLDYRRSYIDMKLEKGDNTIALRFLQPTKLKIEEGFPNTTGGMVFYDLRGHQLEEIGIEVADDEISHGAITFLARDVTRI